MKNISDVYIFILVWHVPLTQVNTTLMIEPNCEKLISIFNLSSNDKKYSNFDISPHRRFEKIVLKNPTHQELSNNTKNSPKFFK
jgi:hypothetical protein